MADFHDAVQALEKVTAQVVSGRDLDETLAKLSPVLTEVMGANHWSVMLKTSPEQMRIRAARGIPEEVVRTARVVVGEGIAGRVARSGTGGLLHDLIHEGQAGKRSHYATGTAICVPIRMRNDVLGVINLNDKKSDTGEVLDFDADDLLLAKIVANQAAMAIASSQALEDAREYERMRASRRAMEAEVGALQVQARAFDIIRQVTDVLVVGGDMDEVFTTIMSGTTRLLDASRGSLMLIDEDGKSLRITAGDRLPRGLIGKIVGVLGEGIAGGVAASGQARLLQHMPHSASDKDVNENYRTSSAISVPLKMHDGVLGVLNINDRRDGMDFTEGDLFISQVVATQAAVVISNTRLLAQTVSSAEKMRDLTIARDIQQAFLPDPAKLADMQIAGRADPAADAGGDYIDFFPAQAREGDEPGVYVVCGDVSGHGLGPALIMATGRAFLHALLGRSESLQKTMFALNNLLEANTNHSQYMTLFLGKLDQTNRSLRYVSGGHEPGILFRADGDCFEYLTSTGMPVGMFPDMEFELGETSFNEGDVLVVATDGIREASNPAGEIFGEARIEAVIRSCVARCKPPEEIISCIKGKVLAFCEGRPLDDDLSLFVLTVGACAAS